MPRFPLAPNPERYVPAVRNLAARERLSLECAAYYVGGWNSLTQRDVRRLLVLVGVG